jgi:hypothetical protein
VAWLYRGTFAGRALALFTLAAACAVDTYLMRAAQSEGFSYFDHTLKVVPFLMIPWLILWILWQVALASLIFYPRKTSDLRRR